MGLPGHSPARWVRRDARNSGLRGTYRTHVETEGRLGQMPDGGCLVCRRSLSRPRHRTSELTIQVPERALLVFCFVSVRIFAISISIPSYHMSSAALAAAAKLSLSFFLSFFPSVGEGDSPLQTAVASADFSKLDAGRCFAPKHSTPAADSRQRHLLLFAVKFHFADGQRAPGP